MLINELYYMMAYSIDEYSDPKVAAKEFIRLNPSVKKTKEVTNNQVKAFLFNVYKGGSDSHQISLKAFVKELEKLHITISKNKKAGT